MTSGLHFKIFNYKTVISNVFYFLFFFLANDIFRFVNSCAIQFILQRDSIKPSLSLCLFYSPSFEYDDGSFVSLGSLLFLRDQFLIQFPIPKISIENEYQSEYQNVELPFGIVEVHGNPCEV